MTEDSPIAVPDLIHETGFAILAGAKTLDLLGPVTETELESFAASWNDLALDTYMADGGRYRRRRHAVFAVSGSSIERQPDQPHYQSTDYNQLNGGIERWFAPVTEAIAHSPVLQALFTACRHSFPLNEAQRYRAELHQFRIEATADSAGSPTPEGMHRDGVDWVCVLLVRRTNLAEGTTSIARPDGTPLGSFTLTQPFDAVFLDDHRVMHGVTAVHPLDPSHPGYRDVLVLTFRAE